MSTVKMMTAGVALMVLGVTGATPSIAAAPATDTAAVLKTYADIAEASYSDSLIAARDLVKAVDTFIARPTDAALKAARAAWITARVPYQQTEAFRFGNPIVDEWEGRVNAWPLDEGLIDYVDADYYGDVSDENAFFTANVIANPQITVGNGKVDASTIGPDLLTELHEIDAIEANVAKGYHAVEFLLWGQDVNGTGPGAGNRPASDFDTTACTGGNCDRRAAYLQTAASLVVSDLEEMVANWRAGGAARKALEDAGPSSGLAMAFKGLGSLSYGELAGERMKLGLMLHDPEEEHDCFSDNTHWSHYYDALGIQNVYTGRYKRIDGGAVQGPSLSDLVAKADPAVNKTVLARLEATGKAMQALVDRATTVEAYDQMIGMGNEAGNRTVLAAINALTDQTRAIEKAVAALGLGGVEFEGSDSLDDPQAVFK
jgi:putative iron-regulated protein